MHLYTGDMFKNMFMFYFQTKMDELEEHNIEKWRGRRFVGFLHRFKTLGYIMTVSYPIHSLAD